MNVKKIDTVKMKDHLTNDIKSYGLDTAHIDIYNCWIGIGSLEQNLFRVFPLNIKITENNIAETAILAGLTSYNKMLNDSQIYKPNEYMKNFLVGCFEVLRKSCHFHIIHTESGSSWNVADEEDLSVWIKEDSEYTVEPLELRGAELLVKLYDRVIPRNIKLAMRRFGHEKAIIGPNFTTCI